MIINRVKFVSLFIAGAVTAQSASGAFNTVGTTTSTTDKVGIGTSSPSPSTRLDLVETTAGVDAFHVTHTASNAVLEFQPAAGFNAYFDTARIGASLFLRVANLALSDTTALAIASSGHVALNSSSPSASARFEIIEDTPGVDTFHVTHTVSNAVLEFIPASGFNGYFDMARVGATMNFRVSNASNNDTVALSISPNGSVNVPGTLSGGNIVAKYQDVAEWVPASQNLTPGTVVVLNLDRANEVLPCSKAYDTAVAGVVSARPGVILGEAGNNKELVATIGRVRVKVDASMASIHIGDLLVTSGRSGMAMKSVPLDVAGMSVHRPGTIIGKALEPLASGQGDILVLLSMQ